jgi:hypothetical protein
VPPKTAYVHGSEMGPCKFLIVQDRVYDFVPVG